jgi:copper chaperone CopZ
MKLKVDIPCSGHAKLISDELYAIDGVKSVKFNFPDIFEVSYDSSLVSKSQILGIDVLKEFVPTVVS